MKALKLGLLSSIAIALAGGVAARAEEVAAKAGHLAVATLDGLTLHDAARKLDLVFKVYCPKEGGPYPVILFSHGFGANKDAFEPIGRHWASHGYVVFHPSHEDMATRGPAATAPVRGLRGGGLAGAMDNPQKIGGRIADLELILDSLETLPTKVEALAGKMNRERIGVGGHSFGAYTAMLMGGVTADLGDAKDKSYLDRRVRCILPISGQGTGQQGLTAKSWSTLAMPMMTITGTLDRGAKGQGLDWKKEPYVFSPPGDKFLVVIEGATHVSFGRPLGLRGGEIVECVKLATTHYWDAYLKDDEGSKKYLRDGDLAKESKGKCTVEGK